MAVTASKSAGRPTPLPTNKVISAGVAGAIVTVAVFIINNYLLKDNQIPADVSAALTTIVSAVVSYYTDPSVDQTTMETVPAAQDRKVIGPAV